MLSCTEEGMCVGVGGFMFWQILLSISLYVWFLEGFDMYVLCIIVNLWGPEQVWFMMFNETVSRDTSSIIGPD